MEITVEKKMLPVMPSSDRGFGKRLTINCPDGWDDVKKLTKKVLTYNGDHYKFLGWCSDKNVCFFGETQDIAKVR